MMQSTPTRKPRRGRLWQFHPVVLLRSTEWCTTMAPPTHLASDSNINTSVSSGSGLPAHLNISTSGQHLGLYLHLRMCCTCLRHRLLELPPATPASTVPKKSVTQGHVTHAPRGPQKVKVVKTGRVNYTTMEDVPEGEQVLVSMFSLNGHPTVILFFISVSLIISSVRHAPRVIS
jgi:hypothetical protein